MFCFAKFQANPSDLRSVLNPLSSNNHRNPAKRGNATVVKKGLGKGSPPKKARGRGGRPSNSLVRMFDPTIANKLGCKTPEDLREEILRRVGLDHSYANFNGVSALTPVSSSDVYSKPVDPAFYNLLEAVEGSERAELPNRVKLSGKRDGRFSASSVTVEKFDENGDSHPLKAYNATGASEVSTSRRSLDSLAQLLSAEINGQVKKNLRKEQSDLSHLPTQSVNTTPDLYQPYDDKYKNFNLLLKCLTNDSTEDRSRGRKRCYSQNSADSGHFSGKATIAKLTGSSQDVKCQYCMKVFSNGIYLRKHKIRAHSNMIPGNQVNITKGERVSCPLCFLSVEKQKMEQHVSICTKKQAGDFNETLPSKGDKGSNNATCQFCGVRMRRQMLVKHLANKHCIENKAVPANIQNDGNHSDTGSSTLSGTSDVENKCVTSTSNDNIIQCDICFAFVPKPMLPQHVAEKHFNIVSGTGYTAGLNNGSSKDETDKSETISDSPSFNNNITLKSPTVESNDNQHFDKSIPAVHSAEYKQYMLHRFLTEGSDAAVCNNGVFESVNSYNTGPLSPSAGNKSTDTAVYGTESYTHENAGVSNGNGSYTAIVVKSGRSASVQDTINALTERISPQMKV